MLSLAMEHQVLLPFDWQRDQTEQQKQWCEEHQIDCRYRFEAPDHIWTFDSEDDAFLFKLRWY